MNFLNNAGQVAVQALEYLSRYDRPTGGQEKYNAEHLQQIARELRQSMETPKLNPAFEQELQQQGLFPLDAEGQLGSGNYMFIPLPDISAFELAQLFPAMLQATLNPEGANIIVAMLNSHPPLRRHFRARSIVLVQ